ncbi:hypothetical protein JKF63_07441 [Porcisia hertigi]|uniref:Uncharacterized protein n=1 Tax=Porcisia hertigi TaxID=2761500 RepID=A0A836LKY8_9TRYP|nr:hypothetical protein JKF63_07441 [Porcisia hertigi]
MHMSRFAERVVSMAWGHDENTLKGLEGIASSDVEGGYTLLYSMSLGILVFLVMWAISRYINRTYSRVHYASEYRDVEGNDYVTSSSCSSSGNSSSDDDATYPGNRQSRHRPTIDEVAQASRQLTEQETMCRRHHRNFAAWYEHGGDASGGAAPDGETEGRED